MVSLHKCKSLALCSLFILVVALCATPAESACGTPLAQRIDEADYQVTAIHSSGNYLIHLTNNGTLRIRPLGNLNTIISSYYIGGGLAYPSSYAFDTNRNAFVFKTSVSSSVYVVSYDNPNIIVPRAEIASTITSNQNALRLAGNILFHGYFRTGGSEVKIYNLANLSAPLDFGFSTLTQNALIQRIQFSGQYLYSSSVALAATLQITDVTTDPRTPFVVKNFTIGTQGSLSVIGTSIDGRTIYVVNSIFPFDVLYAVNVTNTFSPSIIAAFNYSFGLQTAVESRDQLWIGTYSSGSLVLDGARRLLTTNSLPLVTAGQMVPVMSLVASPTYAFVGTTSSLFVYVTNCTDAPTTSGLTSSTTSSNTTAPGSTLTSGGSFTSSTGFPAGTTSSTSGFPATTSSTSGFPGTTASTSGFPGTTASTSGFPGTTASTSGVPATTASTSGFPATTASTSGFPATTGFPGSTTGNPFPPPPPCNPPLFRVESTGNFYSSSVLFDNGNKIAAINGTQFIINDISDDSRWILLSSLPLNTAQYVSSYTFDADKRIVVYTTVDSTGWYIVNFTDFYNPRLSISVFPQVNTSILSPSVKLLGNFVYFSYYSGPGAFTGLVYNIAPPNPFLIGPINITANELNSMIHRNGYIYHPGPTVAGQAGTIVIRSLAQFPQNPPTLNTIIVSGPIGTVSVLGFSNLFPTLFVTVTVFPWRYFHAYNLGANPTSPNDIFGALNVSSDLIQNVVEANGMYWLGTYSTGVTVISTTGYFLARKPVPTVTPTIIQQIPVMRILANSRFVYASTYNGVFIYVAACNSTSTSTNGFPGTTGFNPNVTTGFPQPASTGIPGTTGTTGPPPVYPCTFPRVRIVGNDSTLSQSITADRGTKLIVLSGTTLLILDISDQSFRNLGSYPLGGNNRIVATGIDRTRNLFAYSHDASRTVFILNFTNPLQIQKVGEILPPVQSDGDANIGLFANYMYYGVYLMSGGQTVIVYNIANPAAPVFLGNTSFGIQDFYQMSYAAGYLLQASSYNSPIPQILFRDIAANPVNPPIIKNLTVGTSGQVTIYGLSDISSTLFITINNYPNYQFRALSMATPLNPVDTLQPVTLNDMIQSITESNGFYWVGTYASGVYGIQIGGRILGQASVSLVTGSQQNPINNIFTSGNFVYAGTYYGLYAFSTICNASVSTTGFSTTGPAATTAGPAVTTTGPVTGPTTGTTPKPTPACASNPCPQGFQCMGNNVGFSCAQVVPQTLFSCDAAGVSVSVSAYGAGGPWTYVVDGSFNNSLTNGFTTIFAGVGSHVVIITDNYGVSARFTFAITCNWCRIVNCGAGACISQDSIYNCVNLATSLLPCQSFGNITVMANGNGNLPLRFLLDNGQFTNQPVFQGLTGLHFVTVTTGNSTVYLNATITPSFCANYTYLGCFQDNYFNTFPGPSRDLSSGPYQSPDFRTMSPQICVQLCLSSAAGPFKYAGLQSSTQCWCGNSYGAFSTPLAPSNCALPCYSGSAVTTSTCGGNNFNSIYDTGISIDYCASRPCGNAACMNRAGAFSCITGSLAFDQCSGAATLTINITGTGPFVVRANGVIMPDPSSYPVAPGNYTIVVNDRLGFSANGTITVPRQPSFAINGTDYKYIGCFNDRTGGTRDLAYGPYSNPNGNMTAAFCTTICRRIQVRYMGLQNGGECWCGASYGSFGAVNNAMCNMPCLGESCRSCGGFKLNSVYDVGGACNPNPCNLFETCLPAADNGFGCVSVNFQRTKCSNTANVNVTSRGSGAPFSWVANGGSAVQTTTNTAVLGLSGFATSVVSVTNNVGAATQYTFDTSNLNVTLYIYPLACANPPVSAVYPAYNRGFLYNGTMVDAAGIRYNYTGQTYTVPAGNTYTYTSECGLTSSVAVPAPAAPGAPGAPTLTIDPTNTRRVIVTFLLPASLSVAVNNYIVSYSVDNGANYIKVAIQGSGASFQYVYGQTHLVYVQAQSCSGLGANSPTTTFLGAVIPAAPLSLQGSLARAGTTATATLSWSQAVVAGDTYTYWVECSLSGGAYSVCGNSTRTALTIPGLSLGVTYTIRVRAQNIMAQYGSYSNIISVFFGTSCPSPSAPSLSLVDPVTRAVTMTWNSVGDCTYTVEFAYTPDPRAIWRALAIQPQTYYTTTLSFVEDFIYGFRVTACNSFGCSSPSNVSNIMYSAPPFAVTRLTALSQKVALTTANISLSWVRSIRPAAMYLDMTYYIQTSTNNVTWANSSLAYGAGSPFGDVTVLGSVVIATGATTAIRVIAKNANGWSLPSSIINVFVAAPPTSTPLINTIFPSQVTQFGQIKITISGLNINVGANSVCKFSTTAPVTSVNVAASFFAGATSMVCLVPAYPNNLFAITQNAYSVSISNDGTVFSPVAGLTVTPAPFVSLASPTWLDSRGTYYYLDGQYFDACGATYLQFSAGIIRGSLLYSPGLQSMEYLIPPGSAFSPFIRVNFYCDSTLIYSGTVAYYDVNALATSIAPTTWIMDTIGDQSVNIPGAWAKYANRGLTAPIARLYSKARIGTYGYFTAPCQWQGTNIVLAEFPLPYSSTVPSYNQFDLDVSVDGGYTWIPASANGQITVAYNSFTATCSANSCGPCNSATSCLWLSKGDGRGWCAPRATIAASNASVQVSTSCSASGVSHSFNPIPVAATVTTLTPNSFLLRVTLEVTFYSSSESPTASNNAVINYDISSLDSELTNSVTVNGPISYSYFTNFASSTTVQLTFTGTVRSTSADFPIYISYTDSRNNKYSEDSSYNLLGGATISTVDVLPTETIFLLQGVAYANDASYPNITISYPSFQFASGSLLLDGNAVATLNTATTYYVINHVTSNLAVGAHKLTAVVRGVPTSTLTFFVVPAPAWVSAIRSSSFVNLVQPFKGLAFTTAFPAQNIFPAMILRGGINLAITPTLSGTIAFAFPLNGLLAGGYSAAAALPPTSMFDPNAGNLQVATNLVTSVTGSVPQIVLNNVAVQGNFLSALPVAAFTIPLSLLGYVGVSTLLVFNTNTNLNFQTNAGFNAGYGLRTTGTTSIVAVAIPTFTTSGQVIITDVVTTSNSNLALDFSTAGIVTGASFLANVSGSLITSDPLKAVLYVGNLYTIRCTTTSTNTTAVVFTCVKVSLEDVDPSIIINAYTSSSANVPSFTADTPDATPVTYKNKRNLEDELASLPFYKGNWDQIPFAASKKRDVVGKTGILVSNVFQGTATDGIKFATNDNAVSVAVWVGFNNSRPAPFGYNIQYSKFNASSTVWTTPTSVDPSITVAGSPQIEAIIGTSKFVAVWEAQNLPSGQTVTIQQALNTTDVYAGLYLADTNKWSVTKLTTNTIYDGTPTVCTTTLNGDQLIAVVWKRGNFLAPQDVMLSIGVMGNDISTSIFIQPVVIVSGLSSLSALSCSWSADTVAITYTYLNSSVSSVPRVAMSLYINENYTSPVVLPTISDSIGDSAPVQTLTSSGQFVSAWRHGNNILVKSTLLDGTSAGPAITIALTSQPSLIYISASTNYVTVTYYLTVNNVGQFYMQTLANGAISFSPAVSVLQMASNEAAIAAESQLTELTGSQQLLLVYSSTIVGSFTSHHYALIDLKPFIQVQSIALKANTDGTLGVDLIVKNTGTWDLAASTLTAYIYQGVAAGAQTQLGSIPLPALSVNAGYEAIQSLSIANLNGGFLWIEVTTPADTYLDLAQHYGYPMYTPTISSLTAASNPSGGITLSANIGATAAFTCTTVSVPVTFYTLDPSTGLNANISTVNVVVPCGSSNFVQVNVQESQITGSISVVAGQSSTAITSFSTTATASLSVSLFADLVVASSSISVTSPFLNVAQVVATVQNTGLFTARNITVGVYVNNSTGVLVSQTVISSIASQASIVVTLPLNSITVAGNYTLAVVANPARTVPEVNYANNVGTVATTLAPNAYIQISASSIQVGPNYVTFSASNLGNVTLGSAAVTVSVGGVLLGSVTVRNLTAQYCSLNKINATVNLTADPFASVVITIPPILSGDFVGATVTTTVGAAQIVILPDCGNAPVNAAPGLKPKDNLVAIVGIQYTGVILGTGISPFLAPILAFNSSRLPTTAVIFNPCVNASTTAVCMQHAFKFTPSLSDIPTGQISTTRSFSVALYDTTTNSTLSSGNFTLTITSCGNGVVDPAEQCDGGARCTAGCTFAATPTSSSSGTGTGSSSGGDGDSDRSRRLGLGLGLGLGLPLVAGAAVLGYLVYAKKVSLPGGGIEMRGM